ncbi:hypothetical protein B0H15DRAFT_807904 [Mycena belliarum]|uniref:Uncharacterized protein n=1 Tax=Mycena belliarum TaxID=1033014 RepID=A0AAD6XH77_9AGAR|nr:hypothetical protein B0H15DRAFT_807904 [Mycena belliae]
MSSKYEELLCPKVDFQGLHNNLEVTRKKGRERMARLRAQKTEAQRVKHCEAQRRFAEQIAHKARRAAVQKNAAAGKETKLRPKARQYWSDPDLATDSEEEEDEEW